MDDRFLKTGIFLAPFHPLNENPLLALERDMELLVHLDRLNYHEAWIGEHPSGGFEIIACPEMFIAVAAERTHRIRLGTGVVSLPYHNPFTVAGRLMQLDYMTRGRAMFGVGPGSLIYDAVKMGLKAEDQRRKLDESLDVVMELMQGRTVTRKTDWFDLVEARLQFKSYSQPMMEMAVASARSPTGALSAGSDGGFGGVLLLAHNWADWPATQKSYELMARYVHPHFQRNANELRNWSYDDAMSKHESAGAESQAAVQAAIDRYKAHKAEPQSAAIAPEPARQRSRSRNSRIHKRSRSPRRDREA
jgi:alkanesulfonate monooxygenase SsuD/methylene tetrahydromethanopterin reductase-like flavin-dependent oxidoreductase (luciferase family)